MAWLLAACDRQTQPIPPTLWIVSSTRAPTPTTVPTYTPIPTRMVTLSPSPTLTPTATSTQLPSPTPTMAPLGIFTTKSLRSGIQPEAYLEDQCAYLRMRWSTEGNPPGAVVVPIMFHSITQPDTKITDPARDITGEQFMSFVAYAHYLGFETITTQQLLDFLMNNAPIPPRSMMIIVDDRRPGLIREWVMPVLEEYNWTVTSAYIADPYGIDWAWDLMEQLFATGRMDVQSHGYSGDVYIVDSTPEDKIRNEIWNSTLVLEEHFGVRPIAFIWPGGDFTRLSVEIARQGDYKLGFTAYSRGPLMFNWVPLGEQERAVGDPLMVLPRAWSSAANANLDEAVKISEQAATFAEQNFPVEAAWYNAYCGGEIQNTR